MADAPSGGSKLAGVEILLLVILGLGALAVLSGNPITPVQQSTRRSTTTQQNTAPKCAITLSRPKSKERINGVVTLVGSVTPCTNTNPLATILTAQVVDRTGAPMSDLTRITMAASSDTTATFSGSLPITGNPVPGTGYIIVTGPVQYDGTSLTARTPITF
ncbi:MAG TPA: hypothetical protein VL576_02030 [Candidatus Paceibacterota bacterium]|jgi:hypothetical protein|nr:hypothetical protein [Candidatus Paceibacterota bacterium]